MKQYSIKTNTYALLVACGLVLTHGAFAQPTASAGSGQAYPSLPPAVAQIKAGKIRAIGVSSATRAPVLPDLPTIAESGVRGYAFPQRRFQRPPGIVYDAAVFTELASFFFFQLRVP